MEPARIRSKSIIVRRLNSPSDSASDSNASASRLCSFFEICEHIQRFINADLTDRTQNGDFLMQQNLLSGAVDTLVAVAAKQKKSYLIVKHDYNNMREKYKNASPRDLISKTWLTDIHAAMKHVHEVYKQYEKMYDTMRKSGLTTSSSSSSDGSTKKRCRTDGERSARKRKCSDAMHESASTSRSVDDSSEAEKTTSLRRKDDDTVLPRDDDSGSPSNGGDASDCGRRGGGGVGYLSEEMPLIIRMEKRSKARRAGSEWLVALAGNDDEEDEKISDLCSVVRDENVAEEGETTLVSSVVEIRTVKDDETDVLAAGAATTNKNDPLATIATAAASDVRIEANEDEGDSSSEDDDDWHFSSVSSSEDSADEEDESAKLAKSSGAEDRAADASPSTGIAEGGGDAPPSRIRPTEIAAEPVAVLEPIAVPEPVAVPEREHPVWTRNDWKPLDWTCSIGRNWTLNGRTLHDWKSLDWTRSIGHETIGHALCTIGHMV